MDYNSLLQQARKLVSDTQFNDELPAMERTLPQVLMETQELHARVTQTGALDTQAYIHLGSKGIDLSKISQKLDTLSSKKTFEPLDPISDTDIQSFLRNEKENAILSVSEQVHKSSTEAANTRKWTHIMSEWRDEKVKLMNALIGPSQNWIDIRKGPEQTILNETVSNTDSALTSQEIAYAKEVYDYNKCLLEGGLRPNLIQKFAKLAESFNDAKVTEMWEILKYMVNVPSFSRAQDPLKSRVNNVNLIGQAKKYLETRYKLYMSKVTSEQNARLGGVPSNYNLVSAYVGLKFSDANGSFVIGLQDGFVDGRPLWPMVYYCLRCGDLPSAVKCLQGTEHRDIIQALEERMYRPEQRLNSKLETQLRMQYKRQVRNTSTDPYKRAVYCIVASCDVTEQHAEVAKTSDDFLWIQLSLIRMDGGGGGSVSSSDQDGESFTYNDLQKLILEQYGEKHFNATEQPHLYFQMLTLTGQFEAAIEFLSRFDRYRTHALHIALGLNELFMIAGPRNVQQPLLSSDIEDPSPARRLNVARLIMLYVKKFEVTDPAEAIQYFYFLRNLSDTDGRNLFLVAICDLAIECREYDLIFGRMQENGIPSQGLINQFSSVQIDVRMACELVAIDLIKRGMIDDAIKMYDLAGNREQALHHTSVLLSQVVHQPKQRGSLRERIEQVASQLLDRYSANDVQCDAKIVSTFQLLCELLRFFDCYFERKFQAALDILEGTRLIPFAVMDLDLCIGRFKELGAEVCKVFPDLLLATMDILYSQYKMIKTRGGGGSGSAGTAFGDSGNERDLSTLRDRAKALTSMAATIPYRMPGDTNSRLVQTEILMH